jgi:protein-S-isoprenylcysteine O-methyltransferase Ste14
MSSDFGKAPLSPGALAARMVVYAISFLVFIVALVPAAFHFAARAAGLQGLHERIYGFLGASTGVIGIGIFAFGIVAYFVCSLWLVIVGKGPFVEFDPPREFVASGPYRWMRNPVAASLIVAGLGEAVYFQSVGILIFVLCGPPLAHLQVTKIEEPRLRQRFGASYEEYCRKVNRWLPCPPRG